LRYPELTTPQRSGSPTVIANAAAPPIPGPCCGKRCAAVTLLCEIRAATIFNHVGAHCRVESSIELRMAGKYLAPDYFAVQLSKFIESAPTVEFLDLCAPTVGGCADL
jgi:hypothetical protein